MENNKYKKIPIKGFKVLNTYPVYSETLYNGHEPMKIVGIREGQVELEGDFSGGTHKVIQREWFDEDKVFVVKNICDEDLKPNGCQVHNIFCCGGGYIIKNHIEYWKQH